MLLPGQAKMRRVVVHLVLGLLLLYSWSNMILFLLSLPGGCPILHSLAWERLACFADAWSAEEASPAAAAAWEGLARFAEACPADKEIALTGLLQHWDSIYHRLPMSLNFFMAAGRLSL